MARRVLNALTFLLWVVLVIAAALAIVDGQAVPLASDAEKALAPLLISRDGSEVTFRGTALNSLRICVEPAVNTFGQKRCLTVGDVRDGLVIKR